jgi:hypothetical protein
MIHPLNVKKLQNTRDTHHSEQLVHFALPARELINGNNSNKIREKRTFKDVVLCNGCKLSHWLLGFGVFELHEEVEDDVKEKGKFNDVVENFESSFELDEVA